MKPQSFVLLVGFLMLAAVGLLLVGPSAHRSGVVQAPVAPVEATPRTLTITGESDLWVKPNVVYLSIMLQADGASAQEAEALTGAFADTLSKRLETLKLQKLEVQIGASRVGKLPDSPVAPISTPGTPTVVVPAKKSYQAGITVFVRTSDLTRLDDVRNLALEMGGEFLGATYTLLPDEAEAARKTALASALSIAAARAQILAGQGGVKIDTLRDMQAKIVKNVPAAYDATATLGPTGLVEVKGEVTATYMLQ